MDQITLFTYTEKKSGLHKIHVITKLSLFLIANLVLFSSGLYESLLVGGVCLICVLSAGLSFMGMLRRAKYVTPLVAMIFICNVLDIHAAATYFINLRLLETQGLFVIKLLISFFLSDLLLSITRISEINELLTLLTGKMPWLHYFDPGLYTSLTLRFIPDIFREYRTIRHALLMRGGYCIKNPVRRLRYMIVPLLLIMVKKSIDTAHSLQIKCTNGQRTVVLPAMNNADLVVLVAGLFLYLVDIEFKFFI